MSRLNDVKLQKIQKVVTNYVAFGEEYISADQAMLIIDEILYEDNVEDIELIDEMVLENIDDDLDDSEELDKIPALAGPKPLPEAGEDYAGDTKKKIDVV